MSVFGRDCDEDNRIIKSLCYQGVVEGYAGNTIVFQFNWASKSSTNPPVITPIDLTGWTAIMDFKLKATDVTPLLTLTSALNGGIVLNGSPDNIVTTLTPTQSLSLGVGKFVTDLKLTDTNGNVYTKASMQYVLLQMVTA